MRDRSGHMARLDLQGRAYRVGHETTTPRAERTFAALSSGFTPEGDGVTEQRRRPPPPCEGASLARCLVSLGGCTCSPEPSFWQSGRLYSWGSFRTA